MFEASVIVLTPGRTGSVLLANHISRRWYQKLPVVLKMYQSRADALSQARQERCVLHGHDLFSDQDLQEIGRIYSVRRDLEEAIISHALANHNHHFHVPHQMETPTLPPVALTAAGLDFVITSQTNWFDYYSRKLKPTSMVVVYEVLIDILNAQTCLYKPTYPDKSHSVTNLAWARQYVCNRITPKLRIQHAEFCDYPARLIPQPYPYLID